jgi:hypothetical protein
MAKEPGTKVAENNDEQGKQWKAGPMDADRLADERKDRERLRAERVEYDADKISELRTERAKLVDEFNAETHQRYVAFMQKRQDLDVELGKAGGNLPHPHSGPFPTNETYEDGTARARVSIAR